MKIRMIFRPNKNEGKEKKSKKKRNKPRNLAFRLHRHFMFHVKRNYWLIKKRPWLFRAIMILPTMAILSVLGLLCLMYFYTGNIPLLGDLNGDDGQLVDFEKLGRSDYNRASYVLDSNNQIIGRFFYEIRDPLKYDEIPELLKNGFIAAEDKRFYSKIQFGIDLFATFRAGLINFGHKVGFEYGNPSGASGISQQLARLLYAEEVSEFRNRTPDFWRKFKEARIAMQLARRYPKSKIMEGYLNLIYFGHGVNGVSEAARYYFGKDLRKEKITPQEVALLVSPNKSPSKYCPIYHNPPQPQIKPDETTEEANTNEHQYKKRLAREMIRVTLTRERNNWVLKRMRKEHYITEKEYRSSLFNGNEQLELEILRITPLKNREFGYGNRLVKEMLLSQGYNDEEILYSGGFKIKTTFNQEIQKIATEELNKQLLILNSELPPNEEKLEGAFVIIENGTGNILALSGGHNFEETQYNRIMASRSPGSGFKPFTYAAAFEFFGKTFDDKICNCSFSMKGGAPGKRWTPKNFREEHPVPSGYIPLPIGMIRSVNLATLNLARGIGIDSVIETAHRTGIWGNFRTVRDSDGKIWFQEPAPEGQERGGGLIPLLPTAIGASDVNLLELTNAYTVFARGGTYMRPTLISELKDADGKIIYKTALPQEKRVLSEETANKIIILMRAVTKFGTAKISMKNIEQQVAVKTGTSNFARDLQMYGGPLDITIGIRIGYDSNKSIELPQYMKKVSGRTDMQVSGGWVVGPVFRKIIDKIYEKRQKIEFSPEIEEGLQKLIQRYGNR